MGKKNASQKNAQEPSSIFERVYQLVLKIPAGRVASYGQIARMLGNPRLSRVVGYAMAASKDKAVPCHRVVNRFGGLSEAFSFGGINEQRLLLELEGVKFTPDGNVDPAYFWFG